MANLKQKLAALEKLNQELLEDKAKCRHALLRIITTTCQSPEEESLIKSRIARSVLFGGNGKTEVSPSAVEPSSVALDKSTDAQAT